MEHEVYTADPALACDAAAWGGNHTCRCVYRKTVCDGTNHLCMCGSDWVMQCTECKKETNPMATLVTTFLTSQQGDYLAEVRLTAHATIDTGSVARAQLAKVHRAMDALVAPVTAGDSDEYEGPDF